MGATLPVRDEPVEGRTFTSGFGCRFGDHHAVVDSGNEVAESEETNNTGYVYMVC